MNGSFDMHALVTDLTPVRPVKPWMALMASLLLVLLLTAVVVAIAGMRPDLFLGAPSPVFLWRAGTLMILGIASAHALSFMATPGVGKGAHGWIWAAAGAALFPLAAITLNVVGPVDDMALRNARYGLECFAFSALGGLGVAVPMVRLLRRGAPTDPTRAGWLTGVAAGALGAFAYNFHCPFDDIGYIALWYGGTVVMCACIGRLLVPPLIRW